ncbi:MAG TPA: hypothetical protein VHS34_13400 [Terriglobales bacterium]|jgi:hypothetical protein|nr:hypothetical protein [Terriglobales bacterium]
MADISTEKLGPAAAVSEPLGWRSRNETGPGTRRRPGKAMSGKSAPGDYKTGDGKTEEDSETPRHQVDSLA